ncbi:hypothetical protein GCM10010912_48700 [Paenibacillus albidus]|uniref:Uncharacterized protein n=1 Tax=Paenibacillus albidus TaxID=2041023 RepID=A0A917CUK5_9BACL|nr:hypothetical protein GCM10010912_48700 [Paenibacillus albidus]
MLGGANVIAVFIEVHYPFDLKMLLNLRQLGRHGKTLTHKTITSLYTIVFENQGKLFMYPAGGGEKEKKRLPYSAISRENPALAD